MGKGFEMALKKIMAAAAALSLAAAPTAVSAQAAAPSEIAPATETVEGSEARGGNYLGLIVSFVLVVIIYFIAKQDDGPDSP